ncbi:aldo/keto reductase, partial [Rhizobiaceae sp. 2RAB30]
PNAAEVLLQYNRLALEFNMEPALFANAFVVNRPFVISNIIGATSIPQLETALSSMSVKWTNEMQDAVDAIHQRVGNPCP